MAPAAVSPKRTRGTWIRWMVLPSLMTVATVILISITDEQKIEIAIPVTFNNLANDLLLVDAGRQSLNLVVTGASSNLERLDPKTTFCQIDLAGMDAGSHTIVVDPSDIRLPKGASLSALLTPSLFITLKPLVRKSVDVIAFLEGQPAPGFAVVKVNLKPDRVLITGTAEMVAAVDTIKTHPIDLNDAAESFKKEIALNLPESIAMTSSVRIVLAQIEIKERIVTRVMNQIPVTGKGTAADYHIQPQTISLTVSGPEAIVSTIEANPAFAVTVDLNDLPPGTHSLKATINLPVNTALVHVNPERFFVTLNE